uniref:PCNA-associated factor n=1 Tax=Ciona savignyi TaxID=51511 RepID=H2YWF4_CIOSA
MVRTKASVTSAAIRASAAKAPRKNFTASSSHSSVDFSSPSGKKNNVGGNPVCPRPTPDWQKPIATFFQSKPTKSQSEADLVEKLFEPAQDEENMEVEMLDNKENENPESPEEPVTSRTTKIKRRRILMIQDSDSDTEDQPSTSGDQPSTSTATTSNKEEMS